MSRDRLPTEAESLAEIAYELKRLNDFRERYGSRDNPNPFNHSSGAQPAAAGGTSSPPAPQCPVHGPMTFHATKKDGTPLPRWSCDIEVNGGYCRAAKTVYQNKT